MGRQAEFDRRLMGWINKIRAKARSGAHPPGEFLDLDHVLHELRVYKSTCLLYTSDAADERSSVDLGGRRIIKKKTKDKTWCWS